MHRTRVTNYCRARGVRLGRSIAWKLGSGIRVPLSQLRHRAPGLVLVTSTGRAKKSSVGFDAGNKGGLFWWYSSYRIIVFVDSDVKSRKSEERSHQAGFLVMVGCSLAMPTITPTHHDKSCLERPPPASITRLQVPVATILCCCNKLLFILFDAWRSIQI